MDSCIDIRFDRNEQYRSYIDYRKCIQCGICLEVCPSDCVLNAEANEAFLASRPAIKHSPLVGAHYGCHIGYVNDTSERFGSASGGILTAVLKGLMNCHEIDSVISVGEADYAADGKFFKVNVTERIEDINRNRKSKYYPVEFSKALNEIDRNRRYAVVALPCAVLAIRKAQLIHDDLRSCLRYVLSPVCGHGVTGQYTSYLLKSNGIDPETVQDLDYRDKKGSSGANDYQFKVTYRTIFGEEKTVRLGFQTSSIKRIWSSYMFAMNRCLYCTDFSGELADASFADAWLPTYIDDVRGTSMVVVRNRKLENILQDSVLSGEVKIQDMDIAGFSKAHVWNLKWKKEWIKTRIWFAKRMRGGFPDWGVRWRRPELGRVLTDSINKKIHILLSRYLFRHRLLILIGLGRYFTLIDLTMRFIRGMFALMHKLRVVSFIAKSFATRLIVGLVILGTRTLQRIGLLAAQRKSILILTSAAYGTKIGDEAIQTAASGFLRSRGYRIGFGCHTPRLEWKDTRLADEYIWMFPSGLRSTLNLVAKLSRYESLAFIGTDVCDGFYGDDVIVRRLGCVALAKLLKLRTSVVSFSFNDNPTERAVAAFKTLSKTVRFVCRDPVSLERFSRFTGHQAVLTADIAFLLPAKIGSFDMDKCARILSWINEQKSKSAVIIGVNPNSSLVRILHDRSLDQIVDVYVQTLVMISYLDRSIRYVLVPHDLKMFPSGENGKTFTESDMVDMIVDKLPVELKKFVATFSPPFTPGTLRFVMQKLDFAIASRMHYAISCLSQCVPVVSLTYQDKFEGLYQHIGFDRGMLLDAGKAFDPKSISHLVRRYLGNRTELRNRLELIMPGIKTLAEKNLIQ